LTPEELELLALEHLESTFIELRAACQVAREQYDPVKLAKRHPFVATGLAAAAGFMLARKLRPGPAGCSGQEAGAPSLFGSLLSGVAGAAGRALPELLACWLTLRGKQD
jgi:hypothetical protein